MFKITDTLCCEYWFFIFYLLEYLLFYCWLLEIVGVVDEFCEDFCVLGKLVMFVWDRGICG